jgi:hypothetical protein
VKNVVGKMINKKQIFLIKSNCQQNYSDQVINSQFSCTSVSEGWGGKGMPKVYVITHSAC